MVEEDDRGGAPVMKGLVNTLEQIRDELKVLFKVIEESKDELKGMRVELKKIARGLSVWFPVKEDK